MMVESNGGKGLRSYTSFVQCYSASLFAKQYLMVVLKTDVERVPKHSSEIKA